jgi:hypothetical protein
MTIKYRIVTTDFTCSPFELKFKTFWLSPWRQFDLYGTLDDAVEGMKRLKEKHDWKPTILFEGSYEEILQQYSLENNKE